MNKIYIRFGEIPENEQSKIGNGAIGEGYKCIGYEIGVSVWDAVLLDDGYHLVAPINGNSATYGDFSSYAFPDDCYGCRPDDKIYVVSGDEVGKGSDNEPLLKNVKIIKQLPFDYFKYKNNSKYEIKPSTEFVDVLPVSQYLKESKSCWKYSAMNKNKKWFFYKHKPVCDNSYEWFDPKNSGFDVFCISNVFDVKPIPESWKDSLIKRE